MSWKDDHDRDDWFLEIGYVRRPVLAEWDETQDDVGVAALWERWADALDQAEVAE